MFGPVRGFGIWVALAIAGVTACAPAAAAPAGGDQGSRTKRIGGWSFHCDGPRKGPRGRCALAGPTLAPVRPAESVGSWQPDFGFNEDWSLQLGHIDLAQALGANTNRVLIQWNEIEPERGQYDWGQYDRLYDAMAGRGIKPLLLMHGSPCWARPAAPCDGGPNYPPQRRFEQQWAGFVRLVVKRYPALEGLEVWNEPNSRYFWRPAPSPKGYARLLRVTTRAAHSVRPTLPIVFSGLLPEFGHDPRAMNAPLFQRRAYRAGAGRWVDAVGVHPYVYPSNDPNLLRNVRAQMAIPKSVAAGFGYPRTPLWVTEFGLSSYGEGGLSEGEQATRLVDFYELLRGIPGVPVVILHRLLDLSGQSANWESGMGLATPSGVPKPAFCAISRERVGSCPYDGH